MTGRAEKVARYFEGLVSASGGGLEESLGDAESLETTIESVSAWRGLAADDRSKVKRTLEKIRARAALDAEDTNTLEAIILPGKRPVARIVNGAMGALPAGEFAALTQGNRRATIEHTFASIGCVLVPSEPRLPYGGTGFVVGPGLVMTNRHVAKLFAEGVGTKRVQYLHGAAAFTPKREQPQGDDAPSFVVRRVVMVHPFWDMALLEIPELDAPSLVLSAVEGRAMVAVVGYPAFDPRNNADVQQKVFDNVFDVKRIAPGYVTGRRRVASFENQVDALAHDASTLGGNSGSAVLDAATGAVVALHFAGRYLESNYAVPMAELARDPRVIDAGVRFAKPAPGPTPWDDRWAEVDDDETTNSATASVSLARSDSAATRDTTMQNNFNINGPVTIHIRGGTSAGAQSVESAAPRQELSLEASRKPRVKMQFDEDYENRPGYDSEFLSEVIELPSVNDQRSGELLTGLDGEVLVLKYHHYSLVMNAERRLCMWTAANIDYSAAARRYPGSRDEFGADDWRCDPRVPEEYQISDSQFYKPARKVDRGHVVRREDSAWGATKQDTIFGNSDTFHWTNCTPQHESFNQSGKQGIWGLLENAIQTAAKGPSSRMVVFAGPVLSSRDPRAYGVKYPVKFWKVIVADTDEGLLSYAFVLDQSDVVKRYGLGLEEALVLGFDEKQVTVSKVEELTGVVFADTVKKYDVLSAGESVALSATNNIRTRRAR